MTDQTDRCSNICNLHTVLTLSKRLSDYGLTLPRLCVIFSTPANKCWYMVPLTFKQSGLYLTFSTWFVKNMRIIWIEKIKLILKRHFLENKIVYAACHKMQYIFLLLEFIKLIFRGVFILVFAYMNVGCLKLNEPWQFAL